MSNITIKYGDMLFFAEGEYDEVCKRVCDGSSHDVFYHETDGTRVRQRITFFGDVDYVAMDL